MGWILIYDQDTGELEYLGVPTERTRQERLRSWLKFLPGNVKRRIAAGPAVACCPAGPHPRLSAGAARNGHLHPCGAYRGGSTRSGWTERTAFGTKSCGAACKPRSGYWNR